VIREINYVTVNGLVLTEGVHMLGADKGTVRISNRGSCEKEPKSYYYCPGKLLCRTSKNKRCENSACGKLFTLNKYAGKNTELIFNFSITANGGKNIFWSILREGSKTPLFSGNSCRL
jgi:hypothetical protein